MKSVFVQKKLIDDTLASRNPDAGKRLLEPLRTFAAENKLPVNILEDKDVLQNEAEVHRYEGDLWHCVEGEITFVCGGEMVEPWAKKLADSGIDDREIKAKEIVNGSEIIMRPGDWLWIPAGEPHTHRGTGRLFIIKIPAREEVPLADVPGWTGR